MILNSQEVSRVLNKLVHEVGNTKALRKCTDKLMSTVTGRNKNSFLRYTWRKGKDNYFDEQIGSVCKY